MSTVETLNQRRKIETQSYVTIVVAICIPFTWRACLLAEYPVTRGAPVRPTTLLTVTMLPVPCCVIWGSTCLVMETVPRKLSSIKAWYTSILASMQRERWLRPPLLIRTSIWKGMEMWTEPGNRKTTWFQLQSLLIYNGQSILMAGKQKSNVKILLNEYGVF